MVERVPTVRVCSNNGGFPADGWSPVLVARVKMKKILANALVIAVLVIVIYALSTNDARWP